MLTLKEFRKSRCNMEKNLHVVYEPEKFSCTDHFQMLNNGYDQWTIITLFLFLCYCLTKMLFNSKSRHTNFFAFLYAIWLPNNQLGRAFIRDWTVNLPNLLQRLNPLSYSLLNFIDLVASNNGIVEITITTVFVKKQFL